MSDMMAYLYDLDACTEIWWEQNKFPTVQVERVRDLLLHMDCQKYMRPHAIHLRMLSWWTWLPSYFPPSVSSPGQSERPQRFGGLLTWSLSIKENLGNDRPFRLTLVPGKVMEQSMLSEITQHVWDVRMIRPSQHKFIEVRSCLTSLISFYDQVTHCSDNWQAVDVACLDVSKTLSPQYSSGETGSLWSG